MLYRCCITLRCPLPLPSASLPSSATPLPDSNKTLYYFKTPDDVPKPNGLRGQISLVDCIIEDLDERGNVRPAIGSAMVEMQRGDRASLLLRIRSLDPRRYA
jgi:dynamin GTPase